MHLALPKLASILYQVSCIKGLTSKNTKYRKAKGFTLIELLVVIGILTVLLAIVLIAINPGKQFAQANNTQRRSDVNAILNAIHQYAADNKGALPAGIPVAPTAAVLICKTGTGVLVAECPAGSLDFCTCTDALVTKYLADLPKDPKDGKPTDIGSCSAGAAGYNTTYTVQQSAADKRITVKATGEDEGDGTFDITVTR